MPHLNMCNVGHVLVVVAVVIAATVLGVEHRLTDSEVLIVLTGALGVGSINPLRNGNGKNG